MARRRMARARPRSSTARRRPAPPAPSSAAPGPSRSCRPARTGSRFVRSPDLERPGKEREAKASGRGVLGASAPRSFPDLFKVRTPATWEDTMAKKIYDSEDLAALQRVL